MTDLNGLKNTDCFTCSKVIDFKHPKELQKLIDLSLQDRGVTDDKLLQFCEQIIQYSVKTGESTLTSGQVGPMSTLTPVDRLVHCPH